MTFTIKTHTVIVDDEDAELVKSRAWRVKVQPSGRSYAFARVQHHGKSYEVPLHQCILGMAKSLEIDHVNGNALDNRRENLRFATGQQNVCNRPKWRTKTSSQFKGVCWCKREHRWRAYIMLNYRQIRIGSFIVELDAAKAYNQKAIELHGEFARLNPIVEQENRLAREALQPSLF